jgi:hypothetical protein
LRRRDFFKLAGAAVAGAASTQLVNEAYLTPSRALQVHNDCQKLVDEQQRYWTAKASTLQQEIDALNEKLVKTAAFHDEFGVSDHLVAATYMTFWGILDPNTPAGRWKDQGAAYTPILGQYSSSDQAAITYHLNWVLRSGIRSMCLEFGWIRPNSPFDIVARESFLEHDLMRHMSFSILYHPDAVTGTGWSIGPRALYDDFAFLAAEYFSHPSCLKLDGRIVVVALGLAGSYWPDFGVEGTNDLFRELKKRMQNDYGHDLFLIADLSPDTARYHPSFLDDPTLPFDGILNWESLFYAGIGANSATYGEYASKYAAYWRQYSSLAEKHGLQFIPCIYPGFDDKPAVDAGIVKEHHYIERNPEKFYELLQVAKEAATHPLNMIILFTWNDFHEGHSIEPTKEYGFTYLDIVRKTFVEDYLVAKD